MLNESADRIHKLQTSLNNLPLLQDSIMERERQIKTLLQDVEIVSAKNKQAEQVIHSKTGLCFRLEGDVRERDHSIKVSEREVDILGVEL
jgi:uncharacterized protein YjcR